MAPANVVQRRSTYHSPLRSRQAAQTRGAVLAAAAELFGDRGWKATTLVAVAETAGTAVETVYSRFQSKSELLCAAIDAALAGGDQAPRLTEQRDFTDLGAGSVAERLSDAAQLIAAVHQRTVPLLRALQEAAASDRGAAARLEEYERDRRATVHRGLSLILGSRPPSSLVDSLWAIASPELFARLVIDQGWSVRRYERWLLEVAVAMIERAPK